jgi:short subunit dehydrogenase-like uncharacterized protein
MHPQALSAGIMMMPGTGFDVVPSDCLAAHLKKRLPTATYLQLAFASSGAGASRGTRKTSVESLADGAWVRQDNRLARIQFGSRIMDVDFGSFCMKTLCIPWGDISTAWRSTGIPNIEVYMAATDKMIHSARVSNYFRWALRIPFVMSYMMSKLDLRSPGPSQDRREQSKSFFWGKVTNAEGDERISRLVTQNGYSLTAQTAVGIARKILSGNFKAGYQTPSTAYGADLILEFAETTRTDA